MPTRLVVYTGAPEAKVLSSADEDLLPTTHWLEPFQRLSQGSEQRQPSRMVLTSEASALTEPRPAWRILALEPQHLPTGLSQIHGRQDLYEGVSFLTTTDLESLTELLSSSRSDVAHESSAQSIEQILSQFYEHSYAIHEDISSSQIAATSESCQSDEQGSTSMEADSETPRADHFDIRLREQLNLSDLSALEHVPNALYIHSMLPQTITISVVVGIVSISPLRSINMRRGGTVDLVELFVGDETKSGFGINVWLSSPDTSTSGMRRVVGELRPQDVILIRNVALGSFQGRVYGQSLRRDMTKIHLIHRKLSDQRSTGVPHAAKGMANGASHDMQMQKVREVINWVSEFVGQQALGTSSKEVALPPDTP